MPKRSNYFQRLIYFIQVHLAENATVTESAMLIDRVTGQPREVDVVVQGTVAGRDIVVSLECRDHGRKQDVTWIEQAHEKHSRLPANQLVLVSSSGFSAEAERLAAHHNIHLVTPGALSEDEQSALQIVGKLPSLWAKRYLLTVTEVRVDAQPLGDVDGVIESLKVPGDELTDETGAVLTTLDEYASSTVRIEALSDNEIDPTGDELFATIDVPQPSYPSPEDPSRSRPYFIDVELNGKASRALVLALQIFANVKIVSTQVALTHGEYDGTPYSYGETTWSSGQPISLLVSEASGVRRTTLRFAQATDQKDASR